MDYNRALEKMCAKCIDYETCGGTVCVTKQILRWAIESAEYLDKSMEVNYEGAVDSTELSETDRLFDVENKSYLILKKLNKIKDIVYGFRRRYSDVIRKEIR